MCPLAPRPPPCHTPLDIGCSRREAGVNHQLQLHHAYIGLVGLVGIFGLVGIVGLVGLVFSFL